MLAAIRAGVTGDMAVITEPTGLDVVIAHAGAITFKLTVPGRAAHASVRREGVSALDKLQVLVRALEADETARNGAETEPLMTAHGLPYATIIGTVHGGSWPSTVIDRLEVEGRYGVKLGQTWREAERDLQRCIDDANESDPFSATTRRRSSSGGRFSSSRVPDHPLPVGLARLPRTCSDAPRSSMASRTARTCASSSTTATRRRSSSGPATSALRTRQTSGSRRPRSSTRPRPRRLAGARADRARLGRRTARARRAGGGGRRPEQEPDRRKDQPRADPERREARRGDDGPDPRLAKADVVQITASAAPCTRARSAR